MKDKLVPLSRYGRMVITSLIIFIGLIAYYGIHYNNVYKSIKVKTNKTASIEYGDGNYKIENVVEKIDGKIIEVKEEADPSKVGKQTIVVKVEKDTIVKEVPIEVEVKDTTAPEIKVSNEEVEITAGEDFDILSNTEKVEDKVDGEITYHNSEEVEEEKSTDYYTVSGDVNTNVAGTYPVTIKAVDKYGNKSETTYNVVVKPKYVAPKVTPVAVQTNIDNSYLGTGDKAGLVSLAYSLVGSSYRAGGNSPATGFDCSGFVNYLYSQIGMSISRSSRTQMYEGIGVSYENAQPGDILSWGYTEGVPTHSAVYVGNGLMIHATNPSQGVLVSDVAAWTRGSGSRVIAVRRI